MNPRRLLAHGLAALLALVASAAPAREAACPPAAQPPSAAQQQAAERGARDRGFLWRIERDGQASWLYGTIHVGRYEWTVPGPQLARAIAESRVLALELDLSDPQALTEALLASPALTGSGPGLPAALRARLARRFEAECLPAALIDLLPPTLQAATLGALAGRREGLDPAWAIDVALAARGHAGAKRIVALETLASQLAALEGRDAAETLRFVERTLDDLDAGRAAPQVRRMAEVWARSDAAALERWPEWCQCMDNAGDRALMHRLLDERNGAMAARIDALHREGAPVLAAVGALHMTGPAGLPALLAARGYRVERIRFAP